jgi:hypothetical protein
LEEIADALHKSRIRDLVRCKTRRTGRNGPVIMLLQAGIVEWACEVETGREVLRLTPKWLEAIEDARRLAKEVEADELAARRHRLKSKAFHRRHRCPGYGARLRGGRGVSRRARSARGP